MGLYSIIPGFCGAPWAVGAPRIVTTFHPTSNGPVCRYNGNPLTWTIGLQLFQLSVKCSILSRFLKHNPSLQPPPIIVCLDQSWDKACILIQLIIILTKFSVRWKRAITPPFSSENWALFREIKILQLAPRGLTAQGFRASQVPNYQRTDLRMAFTFTSCTLRTCSFGSRHHMKVSA